MLICTARYQIKIYTSDMSYYIYELVFLPAVFVQTFFSWITKCFIINTVLHSPVFYNFAWLFYFVLKTIGICYEGIHSTMSTYCICYHSDLEVHSNSKQITCKVSWDFSLRIPHKQPASQQTGADDKDTATFWVVFLLIFLSIFSMFWLFRKGSQK